MRASALVLALLVSGAVHAQLLDIDPDWKELDVPPPASFNTNQLVAIEMPRYMSVKLGLVPDSVTLSGDGVVRFVVVATSSAGNTSASYEGIWCRTGEVKVYAHMGTDGKWNPVDKPQWKPLNGNQRSMHALALARQGVCDGRSATSDSAQTIVRKLRQSSLARDQR